MIEQPPWLTITVRVYLPLKTHQLSAPLNKISEMALGHLDTKTGCNTTCHVCCAAGGAGRGPSAAGGLLGLRADRPLPPSFAAFAALRRLSLRVSARPQVPQQSQPSHSVRSVRCSVLLNSHASPSGPGLISGRPACSLHQTRRKP